MAAPRVLSNAPDCNIVFYPYTYEDTGGVKNEWWDSVKQATDETFGMDTPIDRNVLMGTRPVSAQNDIIECVTSKSKGNTGTWQATLGSRVNWKSILHPGCWCMIFMSPDKLTGNEDASFSSGLKMVGIVRSVRRIESTDPESGIKSVRFVVAGEDFHSALLIPTYINPTLVGGISQGAKTFLTGSLFLRSEFAKPQTPDQMVKTLVYAILGDPAVKTDVKSKTKFNEPNKTSSAAKLSSSRVSTTQSTVTPAPFLTNKQGSGLQVPSALMQRILGIKPTNTLFTAMFSMFLQNGLVGTIQLPPEIGGGTITSWGLIQAYCHALLNEVYTDLLPVQTSKGVRLLPSMVFRAIPFSRNRVHPSCILMSDAGAVQYCSLRGNQLKPVSTKKPSDDIPNGTSSHYYLRNVYEHEIMNFNCGKSDRERFNFFFVSPTLLNQGTGAAGEASMLSNLLMKRNLDSISDEASIIRYGMKPYIASSNFAINVNEVTLINDIIKDMWVKAHLYENGVVTLVGQKTHIPIGINLYFAERGWTAHVEQVDNAYFVGADGKKKYRTQVSFVRMHKVIKPKKGKPIIAPVDSVEASVKDGQVGTFDRGLSAVARPK